MAGRCMGMLLQKVDNRSYVQHKIGAMYKHANVANEIDRLGLAKGMGLVLTLAALLVSGGHVCLHLISS